MSEGDAVGGAPYASGGGGTVLEHRYGAILLASLLTRAPAPELGDDATPVSVRFQGRPVSPVDDLIVRGLTRDGERRVSIGVRRAPAFTKSDTKTAGLLASYVRVVADRWEEIRAGRWRLGLAVASPNTAVQQVRGLTRIARAMPDASEFRAEVGRQGRVSQDLRNRLEPLDMLVATAVPEAGSAAAGIDPRVLTWRVLYSLRVRELRLEDGDAADRTAAVDDLRRLTADETAAAGDDLFARLAELAGQYAPAGAEVTPERLRADLAIPLVGPRSRSQVSADAMLRGPVAHLGMTQQLADADAQYGADPRAAAGGYAVVADALASSPYAPHAARIRSRQADALRQAGDDTRAVTAELAVMADALSSGDAAQAVSVAARLAHQQPEIPEPLVRAVNALGALAAYEHDPQAALDSAAGRFDATEPGDPHRMLAATLLAEHAIAARRPEIVQARADVLAGIADATGHDDAGRLADTRLRACIADATGNWDALARTAKRMYPARVAALLLARHGRYLALTRYPEAAIERYNDAIEQACAAGTFADAADWQFAIRDIRISYGVGILADLDDPYRLALASRAAGDDSVIPSPFSPLNLALSDLVDRQFPDALAALRRYRRRSVALADLRAEREASTRLGDVYATAGEQVAAVRHYITSGETDRLKDLAERLPEEALAFPVPDYLADLPPWERAAYFAIVGGAADLLADSEATAWAAVTLAELMATKPVPGFTAAPAFEACNAFSHLADATTAEQARRFLDHAAPWLQRGRDQPRHTDPAHARALVGIAGAHPDLRPDAVDQMCRALLTGQRMAGIILSGGLDQLRAEPATVASQCGPAAARGNFYAALAIIAAGADSADAIPVARAALDAVTSPKTAASGSPEYAGGWQAAATLTRALAPAERARLAGAMAAIITDPDQHAWNKREALAALATAGSYLTDYERARSFPVALRAAGGDIADSDDGPFPRGQLDRVRVITEDATLRYVGLLAAAALAHGPDQFESVIDLAYELMPNASSLQAHRVAQALTLLPAGGRTLLDPRSLAGHESEWIRSAAAALWCTAGGRPAQLGRRLVADPSRHVRRALASQLPDLPEYEDLRVRLRNDIRRSVRTVLHAAG